MNEDPNNPTPGPEPDPQPPQGSAEQPSAEDLTSGSKTPLLHNRRISDVRPIKRKLVTALVALYAVSVIAAGAVLWRSQAGKDTSSEDLDFSPAKSILSSMSKKEAVGVLSISGPIYQSQTKSVFEKGVSQWGRRLERLANRKDVKAIVITINSPGGSVGAVQELYSVIQRVRKKHDKPIVAHLGDVAASGGYYLAVTCDQIVALPGSLVGSIGVIFSSSNIEELFKKIGIKSRVIKSGKMKDIGSMTRPMTPEEHKLLQDLIDNAYGQFLGAVVAGRKRPENEIRPLADGRIFTGEQAMKVGLVDALGDSYEAVKIAAKLGGIQSEEPRIVRDSESFSSMLELFSMRLAFLRAPELSLMREIRNRNHTGLEYRWGP